MGAQIKYVSKLPDPRCAIRGKFFSYSRVWTQEQIFLVWLQFTLAPDFVLIYDDLV